MLQALVKNVMDANLVFKKTHKSRFENEHLQKIIPYIKNIKTMKKDELLELIINLPSYQSGNFAINGKQIIPDKEQEDVIKAPQNCHMRVLAGAGTGKTTTICCRIKYLIDNGVHPTNILMLTFNVEACSNMGQKLNALFNFSINVEVKTIDSFCRKLMYCYNNESIDENNNGIVSVSEYAIKAKKIMDQFGETIVRQYRYVFFDEFQDISSAQFDIIKKFADSGSWVCCIGDDSQNIYQFRGSDNRFIINLNQMIPDVKSYKIQTNYRSNNRIIEIANHCIKKNEERIEKNMVAFRNKDGISDLTICKYAAIECEHIILAIKEYIKGGIECDQIAILGRSSRRLKEIETQLEKEKISYVSLFGDIFSKDEKKRIQKGKLVISTIHSAKGLEWKIVFIVGLKDGEFPSQMNNGIVNVEEERRLFYVAITRAKTHLHFVTSMNDVPLSRFLFDIKDFLRLNTLDHNRKILYDVDENQILKTMKVKIVDAKDEMIFASDKDINDSFRRQYCVTELIHNIQGDQFEDLRNNRLIPNTAAKEEKYFFQPLNFTDEIINNNFESDYGIFCDLYMTRELLIKNNHIIADLSCSCILDCLFMNIDEEKLWHMYDLNDYFKGNVDVLSKITNKEHMHAVDILIAKLRNKVSNMKTPKNLGISLNQYILLCITNFYYPTDFFEELKCAYEKFINVNLSSKQIMREIYLVSLCQKFRLGRRRLVYRDIFNLYEKNNATVIPRIDQWIELMKNSMEDCKIGTFVDLSFKRSNENTFEPSHKMSDTFDIIFAGEIDYINLTDNTLVDIKCSTHDFKLEWLLQLLMYYSILSKADKKYIIKKLAIANIFRGIYYTFDVPPDYNANGLIKFAEDLIKDNLNGKRKKLNIDINHLCTMIGPNDSIDSEIEEFIDNNSDKNVSDESDCDYEQDHTQIFKHNIFNAQKYVSKTINHDSETNNVIKVRKNKQETIKIVKHIHNFDDSSCDESQTYTSFDKIRSFNLF